MSATFPKRISDGVVHELDPQLYRREAMIKSGSGKVMALTVLGMITAEKKYVPINFAADDGSQTAVAIAMGSVNATSNDRALAILTGEAQIVENQLVWPAGTTSAQKSTALGELAELGIVSHQR